ncbi:unnamed protein product [Effrenium voratum]|nr:unnamed protein product [Effrenium voratum]CAJ1435338.1 unnamed protein product [Effrenium voratum]
MHFAQEDILGQNPIAWFPGMAGTDGGKDKDSKDTQVSGKCAWSRFESQASTAVPAEPDNTYQRLISSDTTKSEDCTIPDVHQTSEEAKEILHEEEYADESAMLKTDFQLRTDSSLPGAAAAAVIFLTLIFCITRGNALCLQALWLVLVAVGLVVLGHADFTLKSLRPNPTASPSSTVGSYECEARR